MGIIEKINRIADNRERAKEITKKVIKRGDKDGRPFGEVLQEEIDKIKATKDTDQSSPR